MRIDVHRRFVKESDALPKKLRARLKQRLELFRQNPREPTLGVHALKGKYLGYWSIDVTGDVRALYRKLTRDHIEFIRVGRHSKLYKE